MQRAGPSRYEAIGGRYALGTSIFAAVAVPHFKVQEAWALQ